MARGSARGMRLLLAGLVLVAGSTLGADFTFTPNGLGPIELHTELTKEGRLVRLVASAVNNSADSLPTVRMCVHGAARGCLFTIWNAEDWKPGQKLQWNLTTAVKLPDLAHEVLLVPAEVPKPAVAPLPPKPSKPSKTITVQVVDSETSNREAAIFIPGTAATSSTNCSGSATTIGPNTNGVANCNTTTNPGTAPRVQSIAIPQAHVRVVMPDGRRVALWCQRGFRKCATLEPGNYEAEVQGNSLWMYTHQLDGKVEKIKYQAVGGW